MYVCEQLSHDYWLSRGLQLLEAAMTVLTQTWQCVVRDHQMLHATMPPWQLKQDDCCCHLLEFSVLTPCQPVRGCHVDGLPLVAAGLCALCAWSRTGMHIHHQCMYVCTPTLGLLDIWWCNHWLVCWAVQLTIG